MIMGARRRSTRPWGWVAAFAGLLVLLAGLGLAFAPAVFPYLTRGPLPLSLRPPPAPGFDAAPGPALGQVVDGHWRVQPIAPDTYAIGEPADAPDNYEYLLVGQKRALLIDSGATDRDIHPALAGLTRLPIVVVPTHLHYDHTNGLRHFDDVALVDLPETRGRVRDGKVHLSFREYQGPMRAAPVFAVNEWIRPGGVIDLGGRAVTLLSTPGHTATSISISDPAHKLLFTGDLIYTTSLYAFMPDSSLAAYVDTLDRLRARLPADTRVYGAHCCRNDVPAQAPWLGMQDLADARTAVQAIRTGQAHGRGLVLRRFPVNRRMTLITFYPFGNH